MLVDLVELRRAGVRLPREEARAVRPIRGELMLTVARPGYYQGMKNPPLLALLVSLCEKRRHLIEPLDHARVTKISGGAMLLVGVQQHIRQIRVYENWPQAWWVRPVGSLVPPSPHATPLKGEPPTG